MLKHVRGYAASVSAIAVHVPAVVAGNCLQPQESKISTYPQPQQNNRPGRTISTPCDIAGTAHQHMSQYNPEPAGRHNSHDTPPGHLQFPYAYSQRPKRIPRHNPENQCSANAAENHAPAAPPHVPPAPMAHPVQHYPHNHKRIPARLVFREAKQRTAGNAIPTQQPNAGQ